MVISSSTFCKCRFFHLSSFLVIDKIILFSKYIRVGSTVIASLRTMKLLYVQQSNISYSLMSDIFVERMNLAAYYLFYRTLVQSGMGFIALLATDESLRDCEAAMPIRGWARYDQ